MKRGNQNQTLHTSALGLGRVRTPERTLFRSCRSGERRHGVELAPTLLKCSILQADTRRGFVPCWEDHEMVGQTALMAGISQALLAVHENRACRRTNGLRQPA